MSWHAAPPPSASGPKPSGYEEIAGQVLRMGTFPHRRACPHYWALRRIWAGAAHLSGHLARDSSPGRGEATLITWRWHGELAGPISSKAWNDRRVFENRWKDECRQADVPPSRAPDLTSPHPLIGCACQALLSQTRREEVRGKARVVMGCGSADGDPTKRLM
jgi:hypothetical protein